MEYHKIIIEAMEFLEPEYIINVHTHDPDLVKLDNDVIIYNPNGDSRVVESLEYALK